MRDADYYICKMAELARRPQIVAAHARVGTFPSTRMLLSCARCALALPRRLGGAGDRAGRARVSAWRRVSVSASADAPGDVPGDAKLYLTEEVRANIEVKRSKFVAVASPVSDPAAAMRFVEDVGDPSASHNCFAYKIGDAYRFSDDGEPGGTAGRPILAAIEGSGFDGVVVLVTRYYGGTQLGTGGLIRAYGGAAAKALEDAPSVLKTPMVDAMITAPSPDFLGAIYRAMDEWSAEKEDEEFPEDGSVFVQILVEKANAEAFGETLRDLTNGKAAFRVLDD